MYKSNDALAAGQGVAYKNAVEDKGSISYRAPLRDYSTWSEQPGTSPLLEHARSTGSELVRQMRHYRDGAQQPALFAEKRVYDKGHRSVVGYDEPEAARVWARHYNANTMPLDPSSAEAGSMTTGSQHRSVTSYEIVPGAARPRPKRKRG
jgi:hypothetical protein